MPRRLWRISVPLICSAVFLLLLHLPASQHAGVLAGPTEDSAHVDAAPAAQPTGNMDIDGLLPTLWDADTAAESAATILPPTSTPATSIGNIPSDATETEGYSTLGGSRGISVEQSRIIAYMSVPLNLTSLFLSLCVVIAYLFARYYRPAYANRVSLRLTVLLAAVDALYAFFQLLDIFLPNPASHPFWCTVAAWGYVHCTLLSIFLTCAVALNLHIIFLRGHRTTPAYEFFYLLIPITAATAISLPPIFFGRFGYDIDERSCWYTEVTKPDGLAWAWGTMYVWLFFGIGYCTWAAAVVAWRLAMERRRLRQRVCNGLPSHHNHPDGGARTTRGSSVGTVSPPSAQVISRVVARVVLYPVIPVLTQSLNVVVELDSFFNQRVSFPLIAASFVATACQGLLNALVFLLDPTVRTGWYHVRLELIKRYYLDVQEEKRAQRRGQLAPMPAYAVAPPCGLAGHCRRVCSMVLWPMTVTVQWLLQLWVYHCLLTHRDGHVYASPFDTQPLDVVSSMDHAANSSRCTQSKPRDNNNDNNNNRGNGNGGVIGGLGAAHYELTEMPRQTPPAPADTPPANLPLRRINTHLPPNIRTAHRHMQAGLEQCRLSELQPVASPRLLPAPSPVHYCNYNYYDGAGFDSAYCGGVSPKRPIIGFPTDVGVVEVDAPRPDSDIEGAERNTTAEAPQSPTGAMAASPRSWLRTITGVDVLLATVVEHPILDPLAGEIRRVSYRSTEALSNIACSVQFPEPIPLQSMRRKTRLPADRIVMRAGLDYIPTTTISTHSGNHTQSWPNTRSPLDTDNLVMRL